MANSVDAAAIQDGAVTAAELAPGLFGGVPSTIDPDDAASNGTGQIFALSDHQHPIVTGAPAALTKTAASAESAGTGFARDVHVHATNALPWGVVARHQIAVDGAALGDGAVADWLLDEVPVDSSRLYVVHFKTKALFSAASQWAIDVRADGVAIETVWQESAIAAGKLLTVCVAALWEPSTGTPDVDVQVDNTSGGGTVTFLHAGSGKNTPRSLWVEDVGPR